MFTYDGVGYVCEVVGQVEHGGQLRVQGVVELLQEVQQDGAPLGLCRPEHNIHVMKLVKSCQTIKQQIRDEESCR